MAALRPLARAAQRTVIAPSVASFATSSRVCLEATRPAAVQASSSRLSPVPTAPLLAPRRGQEPEVVRYRWSPLPPDPYRKTTGGVERAPTHTLSIRSSRNNIQLTFSDSVGPLFATISAGSGNTFKKAQRSSYEAAHQATLKMIAKIQEAAEQWHQDKKSRMWINIAYNGLMGQGRDAAHSCIAGPDGQELRPYIARVEDRTPIKIGGTRAPKARRL